MQSALRISEVLGDSQPSAASSKPQSGYTECKARSVFRKYSVTVNHLLRAQNHSPVTPNAQRAQYFGSTRRQLTISNRLKTTGYTECKARAIFRKYSATVNQSVADSERQNSAICAPNTIPKTKIGLSLRRTLNTYREKTHTKNRCQ